MTDITLIMAYYENPGMLDHHYKLIRELDPEIRDRLRVIIVDDASPTSPAKPPDDPIGVPLQIYRMKKDIRWNQDAARNVGVHHSETNWVLLTDIDHIVPRRTWNKIMWMDVERNKVFTFARVNHPNLDPYKFHPNTWLMHRAVYDKAGGYDERFAGYYGTDADFRNRIAAVAAEIVQLKEYVIRVPRSSIPDASTVTYLRKQPEDRENITRIKAERAALKDQTPIRLSQEYARVHP